MGTAGDLELRVVMPTVTSLLEPIQKRIYVEFQHISAFVPNLLASGPSHLRLARLGSKVGSSFRGQSSEEELDTKRYRQVLVDVSGSVRPGELLALMGPSGSGKTTLLSILGSRQQRHMRVRGRVAFNGQLLIKRLKRLVGYVMQDDLLYESLTVGETLHYAAMLRLPRRMTAADKAARVEAVVAALGLEACRDTIIGGFFRKGISGGERKRTSVGHELLINPSLLFLDEPTSGLDSTTALHLLGVLRGLAAGGRAVVTTIHQPSSRLYQHLDKLLLLSQGHVMYYGAAGGAVSFFDGLGYRLPYGVNVADFILDLASGDVAAGSRDGEASRQFLIESSEAYLKEHPLDGFQGGQQGAACAAEGAGPGPSRRDTAGEGASGRGPAASSAAAADEVGAEGDWERWALPGSQQQGLPGHGSWSGSRGGYSSEEEDGGEAGGTKGARPGEGEERWGAPFHLQVAILFRRSLRTRRFETLSKQDIFQYTTIAVLSGLFWLQKANKDTLAAAKNTVGLLFFELMFLSIRALFVALFTFPEEHKLMLKERASGMYRLSAFYLARTLSDLPMDFAVPTAFMIIVYFMGGLRYNGWAFLANYGTNILAMLVAQGIGLLLGALVMNPKSAQTIASVVMLTMVLTGGFFVVGLPGWIAWLKYLSYLYYALGILLFVEFDGGGRTIYRCTNPSPDQCQFTNPPSPETQPSCIPVDDLQAALGLVQDPSNSGQVALDACILLAMMLGLRVAVYWALRRKTRGF